MRSTPIALSLLVLTAASGADHAEARGHRGSFARAFTVMAPDPVGPEVDPRRGDPELPEPVRDERPPVREPADDEASDPPLPEDAQPEEDAGATEGGGAEDRPDPSGADDGSPMDDRTLDERLAEDLARVVDRPSRFVGSQLDSELGMAFLSFFKDIREEVAAKSANSQEAYDPRYLALGRIGAELDRELGTIAFASTTEWPRFDRLKTLFQEKGIPVFVADDTQAFLDQLAAAVASIPREDEGAGGGPRLHDRLEMLWRDADRPQGSGGAPLLETSEGKDFLKAYRRFQMTCAQETQVLAFLPTTQHMSRVALRVHQLLLRGEAPPSLEPLREHLQRSGWYDRRSGQRGTMGSAYEAMVDAIRRVRARLPEEAGEGAGSEDGDEVEVDRPNRRRPSRHVTIRRRTSQGVRLASMGGRARRGR